jgi:hypothetical protein
MDTLTLLSLKISRTYFVIGFLLIFFFMFSCKEKDQKIESNENIVLLNCDELNCYIDLFLKAKNYKSHDVSSP